MWSVQYSLQFIVFFDLGGNLLMVFYKADSFKQIDKC